MPRRADRYAAASVSVEEGERWKRDQPDGEIVLIERVWEREPGRWVVQARPVEPPCAWEPYFYAAPEYIEARYRPL